MGVFQNNAITDSGRILLSYVEMGAIFTPTKIVMGSGTLPPGTTVRTIKNVVNPVQELTINKKKRGNDGTFTVGGNYSNQDVTTGFYFRELALYAKAVDAEGTDVSDEVLYSYGNAGNTADYMPAYTTGQPVERQIDLVIYIGNDTKVDLNIDSSSIQEIEQKLDSIGTVVSEHISDNTIHSKAQIRMDINLTIPITGWILADQADDFPYFIEVTSEEAQPSFSAEVTVEKEAIHSAVKCGLCPTIEIRDGVIIFWAREIPAAEILCHAVLFWDGVSNLEEYIGRGTVNLGYPTKQGGFVEMEKSIPIEQRHENILYGLILADFDGEEASE